MNDSDEVKIARTRIWAGTTISGLVICCGFILGMQITKKDERLESFLQSQKSRSDERLEKIGEEIRALNQRVDTVRRAEFARMESVEASSLESNLYLDSVPCCGEPVPLETTQPSKEIQRNNASENVTEIEIDQVIRTLPEKDREIVRQTLQELNEFRATLSDEDLARLEERTAELKRKQQAQWLSMIAALPPQHRQEAENQLPMMEQAMKHTIEMQALIELEEEQEKEKLAERSRLREITVNPVTAEQMQEIRQQQKMQQALEMLEDAARRQE